MRRFCIIWLLTTVSAIRVPLDNDGESSTTDTASDPSPTQSVPVYYEQQSNVDTYLIPPSPHKPVEDDGLVTYLLPPSEDKQDFFYAPADASSQSDWYPISESNPQNPTLIREANPALGAQIPILPDTEPMHQAHKPILLPELQQDEIPIYLANHPRFANLRVGKAQQFDRIPIPSRQLEPPHENAESEYFVPPSEELELPLKEHQPNRQLFEQPIVVQNFNPNNVDLRKVVKPTLALHLTPPEPERIPTKLYPKKYPGFRPVPIPIVQYEEPDVPEENPIETFNPIESDITDDKDAYLFEKAKQKRKLRKEKAAKQHQLAPLEELEQQAPLEPDTSESHFNRYPGRNAYPAPLREEPPTAQPRPAGDAPVAPPAGDRTEFRMHGMKGPHSYQFGFDTGKGKNRQFRFEERDNEGHVKGHYGYVDKKGKLRVVNYDAHPQHGFRADAPKEEE